MDSVVGATLAGSTPITQDIQISGGNTTALAGLSVSVGGLASGDDGSWVTPTLSATTAPATLTVRVDPEVLASGVRTATLTLAATNAAVKTIRVQLTVRARPILIVDNASARVDASLGDSVAPISVAVRSSGDTIGAIAVTGPTCDTGKWLSATLSAKATPATVALAIDPHGLASGTYVCRLTVQSTQALVDSATRTIAVTLVLHQRPRIALDSASFSALNILGEDLAGRRVAVTNSGTGTLDKLSVGPITYDAGSSGWLAAALDQTTAPATISLVPSAKTLSIGIYTAKVPVWSAADGADTVPQFIDFRLSVIPKPFVFVISPSTVNLNARVNGPTVSMPVSLFDKNGATSSIASMGTQLFGGVYGIFCPLSSSVPAVNPSIPQSGTVGIYTTQLPASCTFVFTFKLTNGATATLTVNISITP